MTLELSAPNASHTTHDIYNSSYVLYLMTFHSMKMVSISVQMLLTVHMAHYTTTMYSKLLRCALFYDCWHENALNHDRHKYNLSNPDQTLSVIFNYLYV